MEYKNRFRSVILTNYDAEARIDKCSELADKLIKDRAVHFAEWIKYNDEVFDKFVSNKISTNNLYGIFLDSLKP